MFGNQDQENNPNKLGRYLLVGLAIVLVLASLFLIFRKFIFPDDANKNNNPPEIISEVNSEASSSIPTLPSLEPIASSSDFSETSFLTDIAIEYIAFDDFYKTPEPYSATTTFKNYTLPLNIKMDVANYYALSRKLDLDPAIDSLNNNGIALLENPWPQEAKDFYTLYDNLETRQIPLYITADFIIYNQQNILKKIYKDIEENIFYDNLWSINKELYLLAKNRYESRLSEIGDINDSLLEAARVQTVFFSVALELLKPDPEQISTQGSIGETGKFSVLEAEKFYFSPPIYLRDDVLTEITLIKNAKELSKSPTLLYDKNYQEFKVPREYNASARLRNMYLAMKWLNSVFPLNYQDENCPQCLLDKEDWRLTTIAAALISSDFSTSPELKNKWARIYKLLSFFNPTRDDLNYVFYRDSLRELFGEDYEVAQIFSDNNPEAQANLQKLQKHLNNLDFPDFLGGLDKNNDTLQTLRGFKILSLPYSPSEYVFTNLAYPLVDVYQKNDDSYQKNVSSCYLNSKTRRCNGFALDFINLIYPITNHAYFKENTSYENYQSQVETLRKKLADDWAWHNNNFWSTLSFLSSYLNNNTAQQPIFAQSTLWRDYQLNTAVGAWINSQLPYESFVNNQMVVSEGLGAVSNYHEHAYIEPNLNLIDELLAINNMVEKMLMALQINKDAPSTLRLLKESSADLEAIRLLIIKEMNGEVLDKNDNTTIINYAKKLRVENVVLEDKVLNIAFPISKKTMKEDLSQLKLKVIIHQEADGKFIAVGPVWDYKETR